MCELLGFSSSQPLDISGYLESFFSRSVRHPHGWGIMYEENESRRSFREPVRAIDSGIMKSMIKKLKPQKNLLAHIRYATVGSVNVNNCHPFTLADISGREWTFIHNGTIFNEKYCHSFSSVQNGETDSERLFLSLIDTVNKQLEKGMSKESDRFELVNNFIIKNAPRNKLNLMIFDGDLLYIHKNLENTLSYKKLKDGVLFSTEPLDDSGWTPLPLARVFAYKDGIEVYRGERHDGIFVPTLDYISAMDAMYI